MVMVRTVVVITMRSVLATINNDFAAFIVIPINGASICFANVDVLHGD